MASKRALYFNIRSFCFVLNPQWTEVDTRNKMKKASGGDINLGLSASSYGDGDWRASHSSHDKR